MVLRRAEGQQFGSGANITKASGRCACIRGQLVLRAFFSLLLLVVGAFIVQMRHLPLGQYSLYHTSGPYPNRNAVARRYKREHPPTLSAAGLATTKFAEVPRPLSYGNPAGVLVLYELNDDAEARNNLIYFVRNGVTARDGADYYFLIMDGVDADLPRDYTWLPMLPENAWYIKYPVSRSCRGFGTYGWAIDGPLKSKIKTGMYEYFILLNSSTRGPFLTPYLRRRAHWAEPLLSKLNEDVKLVGPTISCKPHVHARHGLRDGPYVQGYALATDKEGLRFIQRAKEVFRCYESSDDVLYFSEVGASRAVLRAGFNIDCLMTRYQGVDWRNPETWECNGKDDPLLDAGYGSHPHEVMFVPVNEATVKAELPISSVAVDLQRWELAAAAGLPEVKSKRPVTEAQTPSLEGNKAG